jgi:hypothetical protein
MHSILRGSKITPLFWVKIIFDFFIESAWPDPIQTLPHSVPAVLIVSRKDDTTVLVRAFAAVWRKEWVGCHVDISLAHENKKYRL